VARAANATRRCKSCGSAASWSIQSNGDVIAARRAALVCGLGSTLDAPLIKGVEAQDALRQCGPFDEAEPTRLARNHATCRPSATWTAGSMSAAPMPHNKAIGQSDPSIASLAWTLVTLGRLSWHPSSAHRPAVQVADAGTLH